MIVYRDQRSRADPRHLLAQLRAVAHQFTATAPPLDIARNTLISAGKLESAVADALFPEADGMDPLSRSFRAASLMAGHVLWHTWHSNPEAVGWWSRLNQELGSIPEELLPREIELTVPEGYSQYAVYPEMYLEAAKTFHVEIRPQEAVCFGLRSIGTSLSAVVSAALMELGCSVESVTVRPRGHPFSREIRLTEELRTHLRPAASRYYLLIDEGPGISGSSLAAAAALLGDWGVPDEHVFIFPSWQTDGSQLKSGLARNVWSRHRQFTASFEHVWVRSGKLSQEFAGELTDVSAGAWRELAYSDSRNYPPVQPQHERRKYLLSAGPAGSGSWLLKFTGLGEEGAKKLCRAQRLAEAGYTPAPDRAGHGFLLRPFVPGSPVAPNDTNEELLESVASYLAHLSREFPAQPTVSCAMLQEMIEVNLDEGLKKWAGAPDEHRHGGWEGRVVSLDGRLLAHEWIRTAQGYVKVDAVDHHDDHFFPGCQDIAWDLAAATFELSLSRDARRALIGRYRSLSGDRTISRRLPFYSLAYLAFRLGYSTLAASVLGETPDGTRFGREVQRYKALLGQQLSSGSGSSWDA